MISGIGLLKSNGYVPLELDLSKAITRQKERADAKLARLIHQGKSMRARRFPPSERAKIAFNKAVEKAAEEYDQELRKINSKILTLNISAPAFLHRPLFKVEPLVKEFLASCPLFDVNETG
jgi:DnaJ homolog subfamily C member 28